MKSPVKTVIAIAALSWPGAISLRSQESTAVPIPVVVAEAEGARRTAHAERGGIVNGVSIELAQAVAPLALQLDFEVTVFDDRPTLANSQYFPAGTKFRVDYWEKLLKESLPHRPTFGLIVTRGHQHDALVLREWVNRPFVFLGLIGSKRKRRLIFEQFVEDGLATAEQLEKVACPVGLDIQAVSVPEIAVSVVGQFIQKRAEIVSQNA